MILNPLNSSWIPLVAKTKARHLFFVVLSMSVILGRILSGE